jgi:phosphohistidine phosphatase
MRHAQAANPGLGGGDHERPLTAHGQWQAVEMGKKMAAERWQPDVIFASDAVRTKQTAKAVSAQFKVHPLLQYSDKLYLAPAGDLLAQLQKASEIQKSFLLVAHNPGVHYFSLLLADDANTSAHKLLRRDFPPAALAVIDLPALPWAEMRPHCGKLTGFYLPPVE